MRRALLSVTDKTGLEAFARRLKACGFDLVASGGTARVLSAAGLEVTPVEKITRNAEAFDGRMKTISFEIESAILFDRDRHRVEAETLGVIPIDLVACNLYPFADVVRRPDFTIEEAVEQIDVGGPTMLRAAAKNHACVTVVMDPADYDTVASEVEQRGNTRPETRRRLAALAFARLSAYDALIASTLGEGVRSLPLREGMPLRYGENPHQRGTFLEPLDAPTDPLALTNFTQAQGKTLSYNNLLDADAVLFALCLIGGDGPAACIVKHTNPCGAARADSLDDAFARAWAGDPIAAFGGIVGVNRPVDGALAERMLEDKRFFEILLAPSMDTAAREIFATRKNLRVLLNPALDNPHLVPAWEYRSVRGAMLAQMTDDHQLDVEFVTEVRPDPRQVSDLLLAWQICRASRSNAVTLVRDGMLVGNGVGQQDRLTSCRIAVEKAGPRARGAVAASDAFFPFPDGPEALARAGVAAIIQPGGSVRDSETFALCNQYGVAMATTRGVRCFRH